MTLFPGTKDAVTTTDGDTPDLAPLPVEGPVANPGAGGYRRRNYGVYLALFLFVVLAVCACIPSLLAPFDPTHQSLNDTLLSPGSRGTVTGLHLLGTDELGRDVFSRLIYGVRPLALVVLGSLALSGAFGLAYGMIAAFAPAWVGRVMMRIADIQLAIPSFVLAILLAYLIQPGVKSSVLAIAVVTWPVYARVVQADAGKLKRADYVLAARVSGLSWRQVIWHHITKNVASVFVVILTFYISVAVIIESSLSFLGYGIRPPRPDWGNMLAGGVTYINYWWLAVFPGVAVTLVILASNTLGEFARQKLDPRSSIDLGASSIHLYRRRPNRPPGASAGPSPVKAADGTTAAVLENVSISTDTGRPIVADVSVELRSGVVTAIVGESGSGKSTICLALLGLLPANLKLTEGRITVAGHRIDGAQSSELRRVRGRHLGVVFQDPLASLDPVRRIASQLGEPRVIHKLDSRKKARAWSLEKVQDLGFHDPKAVLAMHPHQLSGGMRQRVCIGIAVAAEPVVLVADEPTTALDVSVRGKVLRSLESYRVRTSAAMLLVTHEIAIVRAIADRVIVLYGGSVLEEGARASVLAAPRSPYTRALMDASVEFDPTLRGASLPTIAETVADDAAPDAAAAGCPFAPRCPRALPICTRRFPERAAVPGNDGAVWCWNPLEYGDE